MVWEFCKIIERDTLIVLRIFCEATDDIQDAGGKYRWNRVVSYLRIICFAR